MSTHKHTGTPVNAGTYEPRNFPRPSAPYNTHTPSTPTQPRKSFPTRTSISPNTPRFQPINVPQVKPQPNYLHLPFLDNAIKKIYEYHNQRQGRTTQGAFSINSAGRSYNQPYIHGGDVIEFYGPSCGGKTTILHHVIVTTIIPKYWTRDDVSRIELNGLGKGILFFDLDGRYDIKRLYTMIIYYLRNRIRQIIKESNSQQVGTRQQLPTPLSTQGSQDELFNMESLPTEQELDVIAKCSLKKLHIFQPNASIEYLATLLSLPEYVKVIQEKEGYEFNYLMIDSINAFYWQDKSEELGEQVINSENGVDTDSDDDGDGGRNENSINSIEMDNFEIFGEEVDQTSSPPMYYNGRRSQSSTPRTSTNSVNSNSSNQNNNAFQGYSCYIVQALQTLLQSTKLIVLATNWVTFRPSEQQQQTPLVNINSRIPQELTYSTASSPYWDSLLKYKFVIAKQLLPQYPDNVIPKMIEKDENRDNLLKEPLFFGRLIYPECDGNRGEIFSFKISEEGIILFDC
ncbi:2228_t:CDS:2 [Funneliformis caledonium]|uniref:2228_t:CDS:1 n=1 Tax=Funneliformis caledonium TaxID=1117310 RepID=A0A9N9BNX5_9GLOM|nr:2228_t:CDS:2 [Funneliformis caledonium]